MRLLVACPKCQRQYDATGREIGTRFRCHCGVAITIEEPRGHDAAVVRCSSCGAPRAERSTSCKFCSADFTLHERDLHTVCPKCFARISDRAGFCSHCGVRLMADMLAGEQSSLVCPACGDEARLAGRSIGEVTALECGRCTGLWLGSEAFGHLTDRAADAAMNVEVDFINGLDARITGAEIKKALSPAPVDAAPEGGWRYRSCPVCEKMMNRRHYGRQSGVIVDICKDHGVWFDAEELPRIIAWIRSGGLAKANQRRAAEASRKEKVDRAKQTTRRIEAAPSLFEGSDEFAAPTALDMLVELYTWIRNR